MIELNTRLPVEQNLNPSQKLLLQLTREYIALEKLDLQHQEFRCYLGHGSYPEVVIKALAEANENFWPIVTNHRAAERQNFARYLYPHSLEDTWKQLEGGVLCLVSGTESYTGAFLRRLEIAKPSAIFHWGG